MRKPAFDRNRHIASVSSLVALIGEHATFRLLERFAGTRMYVPKSATDGLLSEIVGKDGAAKLAGEFGGLSLRIPLGKSLRIKVLRQSGFSYAEIALRVGCSEVTVFQQLKRMGAIKAARRCSGENGKPQSATEALV